MASLPKPLGRGATHVLPGGYGRSGFVVGPVAPRLVRGDGHRVLDEDGRWLIDANNNFAVLVLGHGHPAVVAAACEAMATGVCYGLAHRVEERHAQLLVDRLPGTEQVRFANSGSEAVMTAIRLARCTTGRNLVLGVRGAYHGSSDVALTFRGGPSARGVPAGVQDDVVRIPLNDVGRLEAAFAERGDEIAAVLLDLLPNYAGLVPLSAEFVETARRLCDDAGSYLLFDEVISFRLATGGLQAAYGVRPDLTLLGKAIGGGLPIGAIAGSEEAMRLLNPLTSGAIDSSGTFTGNPVTTSAGIACLEAWDGDEIARVNALGDWLRETLAAAVPDGWDVRGRGSLVRVVDVAGADPQATARALWWEAYERGVLLMPTGLMALSAPMDRAAVEEIAATVVAAVQAVSDVTSARTTWPF